MSSSTLVALRWRPTPMALGLATCVATALAAALISGHWQLAVFAAPLLGSLGARGWFAALPEGAAVAAELSTAQCFEDETVEIELSARLTAGGAVAALDLAPNVGLRVLEGAPPATDASAVYQVTAAHWGNYSLSARIAATTAGGLLAATTTARVAELRVYPRAPAERIALPQPQLVNRLGTHLSARRGAGVEYADIRPYLPGDLMRSINWPASARRGQLQVTERLTDRAADVVAVIDTYPQAHGPATAAFDLSVQGATQAVQSALQDGDRAGVVALGARIRWLGPDTGRRQFYRVLDAVLDFGEAAASSTGTLAPRQAVPSGATVIAFSTLLRTDFTLAMLDLHRRGHAVLVVDVLREIPFTDELDPVAARLWRLERSNLRRDLGATGIDVVAWPADTGLGPALRPFGRRPVRR